MPSYTPQTYTIQSQMPLALLAVSLSSSTCGAALSLRPMTVCNILRPALHTPQPTLRSAEAHLLGACPLIKHFYNLLHIA